MKNLHYLFSILSFSTIILRFFFIGHASRRRRTSEERKQERRKILPTSFVGANGLDLRSGQGVGGGWVIMRKYKSDTFAIKKYGILHSKLPCPTTWPSALFRQTPLPPPPPLLKHFFFSHSPLQYCSSCSSTFQEIFHTRLEPVLFFIHKYCTRKMKNPEIFFPSSLISTRST